MTCRDLILTALIILGLVPVARPVVAKAKPPCVATMADCPAEGCGGDPALNKLKNKVQSATSPEEWSVADIIALEEEIESDWHSGMDRTPIEAAGEGTKVVVTGYLIAVKASGSEACNCGLKGQADNDFHLNLTGDKLDSKDESVVVEITPRVRPAGWELAKLKKLAKKKAYVRVTGWLLLDTQHLSRPGGVRGTLWEVHPVTSCEVCTKKPKDCNQGKGWRPLEDI